MSTHPAVVTVATRAPLALHDVPTISPAVGQVRVRVEWTASTPLDMHQADGGLLVVHPQVLGDGIAGTVVEVGPNVKDLTIGDRVFGFTFHNQQEKAHQVFVTVPVHLLGKVTILNYARRSSPLIYLLFRYHLQSNHLLR